MCKLISQENVKTSIREEEVVSVVNGINYDLVYNSQSWTAGLLHKSVMHEPLTCITKSGSSVTRATRLPQAKLAGQTRAAIDRSIMRNLQL